jgi:hypothetical protein
MWVGSRVAVAEPVVGRSFARGLWPVVLAAGPVDVEPGDTERGAAIRAACDL